MKIKLFFLMLLAAGTLHAQNKLTIVVDGIENVKGHLMIGLYNSDSSFLKKPLMGNYVEIKDEVATVVFNDIKPGEYAVSLFQDENDNKKLDRGAFGIPTEKTGFSNNAVIKMGPPPFGECKFNVEKDIVVAITLR